VPVVVWAITAGEMGWPSSFPAAGISDAVDGFLAKRLAWRPSWAPIRPAADKAMLVSITSRSVRSTPFRWLVILVVSRDIMIVSAVILSWLVDKPVPLAVARLKLNTVAQISLASW
jgi:cardiolipin synthase